MRPFIIIAIIFTFFACKKQIDFNIPDQEKTLVVNSNLCVDSFISFNLSYTQSIKDNTIPMAENHAVIEIFNKDTTLRLDSVTHLFSDPDGYYESKIKAQPSFEYIVKITAGQNIAYWTGDSLPSRTQGQITKVDSTIFQGKSNFFRIRYDLSDKQNYRNYYGLKMKHYYESYTLNIAGLPDTIQNEEWLEIETVDQVLTEDENNKFSKKHILFTDQRFNNNTISFSFGTSRISNNNIQKSKKLVVFMEQYSLTGYEYYASLNEHIFYQSDPFSQPTLVKGNVKNAFGAFIGKNTVADSILFKY